jgi:hypothetical protein
MPLSQKLPYLKAALAGTVATAERQVKAASAAKGIPADSPQTGEEWLGGPVAQARIIRLLGDTLAGIVRTGEVVFPEANLGQRPDGKLSAQVFPNGPIDKVTFAGFSAEVVQAPEVNRGNLRQHMAGFYREKTPPGRVALVLGAGNVASIGPLDAIHKLFVEGQVVILKFNPVNEYLGPFFEEAFAELIRDGFVRTAYGDGAVGAWLCDHAEVDEIHITGSDRTHDAIVFGVGPEGAERKANDTPKNARRVTSELGNVTPIIVIPGPWTAKDLRFQAANLATQLANNGGFNCNAARLIITHEGWPQGAALLDRLRETFAQIPQRKAYYPGAEERWNRFVDGHPQAEPIGAPRPGILPWALIPDLDPEAEDEPCFHTEAWCGVVGQTALGGADAREFLKRAVDFCNSKVWGTLNCSILVHPDTAAALGDSLEQAIDALTYGTVVVNHWAGLGYALGVTPWGAAPGHHRTDIQSGIGFVHNTFMFDAPQKTIIRGPFNVWPTPPWFVTHKATDKVARAMLKLESDPGWLRVPGVVLAALRG